jgi:hypothetical protein
VTVLVGMPEATYNERTNSRGAQQRQYDYFGKSSSIRCGAEAFLVDYGPDRTTGAHFHSVDQFQVFFGSEGARYQRHQIPEVELHYADAFVTYGPFSASGERMRFFTLRAREGQFKGEMPSERHKLRYRGRRGLHLDVNDRLGRDRLERALPAGRTVEVPLIDEHADGLAATLISAGPGSEIVLPSTVATSGRYFCVLAGALLAGTRPVGPMALGWSAPDEPEQTVHTDHVAVTTVLTMTFPFPATPDAVDSRDGERDTRPTSE